MMCLKCDMFSSNPKYLSRVMFIIYVIVLYVAKYAHGAVVPEVIDHPISIRVQNLNLPNLVLNGSIKLQLSFLSDSELEPTARPRDCSDIQRMEIGHVNGKYLIYPHNDMPSLTYEVYCDFEYNGGGWTVIQRRGDFGDPVQDFYVDWATYVKGFGNLEKQFWLGLYIMSELTSREDQMIHIQLTDWENVTKYAQYEYFRVANSADFFRLSVADYSGDAGDSFRDHNGNRFTTKDMDNDNYVGNCAVAYTGAWWYNSCHEVNLNGFYYKNNVGTLTSKGIVWKEFKGHNYSLKTVEMKIRRKGFADN